MNQQVSLDSEGIPLNDAAMPGLIKEDHLPMWQVWPGTTCRLFKQYHVTQSTGPVIVHNTSVLWLYQISAPAPVNPESRRLKMWSSPVPGKLLAGFGECQCSCSARSINYG